MIFHRYVYRNEADEGADLGGDTIQGADTVQGADTGEAGPSPEIIAKAEKMGWTPKDQFKGDPAKWRPADEFVERGESMLPIVRATVKRQERQIADLTKTVQDMVEYQSKTEQRAMQKALDQLRQERADAIAKGDGVAFDKVDAQIEDLRKKAEAKPAPQPKDGEDPVFQEWLGRNRWAEDTKMQRIAHGIAEALVADGETARGTELLDMVAKEVKQRYPEKFENPRRKDAPTVEGGAAPRRTGGKTFADMPADARAACERMAKNGYAGKPEEMAKFKADYVKNFFEQE